MNLRSSRAVAAAVELHFDPATRNGEPVAVKIGLPQGASFSSPTLKVAMNSVRGWHERQEINPGELSISSQNLTNIPASFQRTDANVAATLYSPDAVAMDFSAITFSAPSLLSRYRPWLLPAAACLIFSFLALWFHFEFLPRLRSIRWAGDDTPAYKASDRGYSPARARFPDTYRIENILRQLDAQIRRYAPTARDNAALLLAWDRARDDVQALLPAIRSDEVVVDEPLTLREFQLFLRQESSLQRAANSESVSLLRAIQDNSGRLEAVFFERQAQLRLMARQRRFRSIIVWTLASLALIAALALLAAIAKAQHAQRVTPRHAAPVSMLCDLDILLTPHEATKMPEKVDVLLRFSPLTGDSHQKTTNIELDPGKQTRSSFDPPATPPTDTKIVIQKRSPGLISLTVPTTYSAMLRRLGALSRLMTQLKVPPGYASEVAAANQVAFSYTMQGSQVINSRSPLGNHWLYLFPFDSAEVDVTLHLHQAALLTHVQLLKPAREMYAEVRTVNGVPISLTESESAEAYEYINADASARTPMWEDKEISVHATFKRSVFQRWALTAGMAVFSIVIGFLTALCAGLSKRSFIAQTVGTVGGTGLVLGIRTEVLHAYPELPTLLTGQGISYFELIYYGCVVLMIVTNLVARPLFKKKTP